MSKTKTTKKIVARSSTLSARTKVKNKSAEIIKLMRRPKGVTRGEVLGRIGWKAISMQQVAEGAGVKLKVDASERPYRYRVV